MRLHERTEHAVTEELTPRDRPLQIRLFEPEGTQVMQQIRGLNLDEMRPLEALQFLNKLQKELN